MASGNDQNPMCKFTIDTKIDGNVSKGEILKVAILEEYVGNSKEVI